MLFPVQKDIPIYRRSYVSFTLRHPFLYISNFSGSLVFGAAPPNTVSQRKRFCFCIVQPSFPQAAECQFWQAAFCSVSACLCSLSIGMLVPNLLRCRRVLHLTWYSFASKFSESFWPYGHKSDLSSTPRRILLCRVFQHVACSFLCLQSTFGAVESNLCDRITVEGATSSSVWLRRTRTVWTDPLTSVHLVRP